MDCDGPTATYDDREHVRGAVLDLLDLLAERGDRLGIDNDDRLEAVAAVLSRELTRLVVDRGGLVDVVAALDTIRGGLERAALVEAPPRSRILPGQGSGADPLDALTRRLIDGLCDDRSEATDTGAQRVRRAVRDEADRFRGAAVHGFLPILIERRVRRSITTAGPAV